MKKKTKKMNEDVVSEEGLRDWFGKSSGTTKSGRKVRGWVQVGGEYDGKPCARQPGQKSTPKCVSSAKRRSMSKDERDSAARRKRKADPNQPQKSGAAKPTNVSTDPKKKMKEEFGNPIEKVTTGVTAGILKRLATKKAATGVGKGYMRNKVQGTTYNQAIKNPKNINAVRAVGLTAAGAAAYAPIVGTAVAPETTQKVMKSVVDRVKEFSKPQLDVNRGGKKKEEKKDDNKMEAYDLVLEYLLSTEQADTIEEANYIMTEMDAKTIQDIVSQQLNEQN